MNGERLFIDAPNFSNCLMYCTLELLDLMKGGNTTNL